MLSIQELIMKLIGVKTMSNNWISCKDQMPLAIRCIDQETGYYYMSEQILCCAYNREIYEYEMWIDYTIDGEWQAHEYDKDEELFWMPLPSPPKKGEDILCDQ